ncbi:MAG: phosphoribosylformylglycinamidine synthase subunit PurQ [archaeon]
MAQARVLVWAGEGLNCEAETEYAFNRVGGLAEQVHVNDFLSNPKMLRDYQILAGPGGFSYGDHTGAGKVLANRLRRAQDEIFRHVDNGRLVIGICNDAQVLAKMGLAPALGKRYGERQVAFIDNDPVEGNPNGRYWNRWVDLKYNSGSPWTRGVGIISMPMAHGEGNFYASPEVLAEIKEKGLIAARYVKDEICMYEDLVANPNGSLDDIAGIFDETKNVLLQMPHPERAQDQCHRPDWMWSKERIKRIFGREKMPEEGEGLAIFRNGVSYFS